jgi:hypothetical protein
MAHRHLFTSFFSVRDGANGSHFRGVLAEEFRELGRKLLPGKQRITGFRGHHSITSRAAECLNIADRVGAIRPGPEADLVVLGRNPLDDIAALKDVQIVINDGTVARSTEQLRR